MKKASLEEALTRTILQAVGAPATRNNILLIVGLLCGYRDRIAGPYEARISELELELVNLRMMINDMPEAPS